MKPKKFCLYKVIDTLLWTLILLLPIILYAIHIVHHDSISLLDFISQKLSVSFNQDSVIYVGIEKLFTNGFGFFDIFNDMGFALEFFVWFFFVGLYNSGWEKFSHVIHAVANCRKVKKRTIVGRNYFLFLWWESNHPF